VAYIALFFALGGTAAAATGGTFLLGKANSAGTTSTLSNTGSGVALSLNTKSGVAAPLAVNSSHVVPKLNADFLDGLHGSGYLRLGTANSESAPSSLSNSAGTPLSLQAPSGKAPLAVSNSTEIANLDSNYLEGLTAGQFGAVDSANISVPPEPCTPIDPVNDACPTFVAFGSVSGVNASSPAVAAVDTLSPNMALLARDLSVSVTAAPGPLVFLVGVSINDSLAAPLCSITGSSTTCADSADLVPVPAGSRIAIFVQNLVPIAPNTPSTPAENVLVGFRLSPQRQ
jgi:hypothetical protein